MESQENTKILVITVDVSEKVKGTITVHSNDDPNKLSEDFVTQYSLDRSMKTPLITLIKSHQEKHRLKRNPEKINNSQQKENKSCEKPSPNKRIVEHQNKPVTYLGRSSSHSKINYGKLLYEKGVKMKENIRQISEKIAKEKNEESEKELTFKPQISEKSTRLARRESSEKRLAKSREHAAKLKEERDAQEMKECYFKPVISLKENGFQNKNIFDSLYADACKKIQKTKKNSPPKPMFSNDTPYTDEFFDRLANSKKKTDEEISKLRKEFHSDFDEITGQKLFTPAIGRSQLITRSDRSIWEELYHSKDMHKEKMEEIRTTEMRELKEKSTKASNESLKLLKDFKHRKFEKIFKALDSDLDGKISFEKISLRSFDKTSVATMLPILQEIETNKKEMDFNEFCQKFEEIYDNLNLQEKTAIGNLNLPASKTLTFTPAINENSKKLSKKVLYLGKNIYERAKAAKTLKDLKQKKTQEIISKTSN